MSLHTTMLESVCTVRRPATSRDAVRGLVQSFNPGKVVAQNVPCSFQQPSAATKTFYAQRNIVIQCQVFFDSDPGAEVNDRLEVTVSPGTPQAAVKYVNVIGRATPVARNRLWSVDGELVGAPA